MAAAKTNDQLLKKQRLRDQAYLADKMVELLVLVWDTYQKDLGIEELQDTENMSLADLVEVASTMEITPGLFAKLRATPKVQDIFRELDVADEDQCNLFETLDADGGGTIDVEELCEGIAKLRGDARRSDVIGIMWQIRNLQVAFMGIAQRLPMPPDSAQATPRSAPVTPRSAQVTLTPRTS